MKFRYYIYIIMCAATVMMSCSEASYSESPNDKVVFSTDTIRLDTVFSNVPTATRDFWVFNTTKRNIRMQTVRLERGNQSGFRVNVDGVYLGPTSGYQTNDVEVRSGDSIRVFVELTAVANGHDEPQNLTDNIVFRTEGGAEQRVALDAYSWDAIMLENHVVKRDTTFTPAKPIVVYGNLRVDTLATLTMAAGTTVYFRDEARLDVFGRLITEGEAGREVTLRGYRLDRMFDYLPYDRISGQWGGVRFHESSYDNELNFTDLHSAFDGVVCDSCNTDRLTLRMTASTVHNCQGYGLLCESAWIELFNCQLSNTFKDCLSTSGGVVVMNNCTLAQFYPYDSARGVALRFTAEQSPIEFVCYNSLVTGYADDEIMGEQKDTLHTFYYDFHNCILRTPKVETADSIHFGGVIFEDPTDTLTTGKKHFALIDTENLSYDFRLSEVSPAIGAADPRYALPTDRLGLKRDDKPDIGAYEHSGQ